VVATIPVGSTPQSVAVTPNGDYVYTANFGAATVSVISTATDTVTATIPVETGPFGVAVTPNGNYVYVANSGSGTVSVISTATNRVTATITGLSEPLGVAVTPNGAYAYVTNDGSGTVSVISTATNKVTATITVGSAPYDVAIAPNCAYAYVTNSNSATVSVINVVPSVSVSPSPRTMDVGQSETLTATPTGGSGSYTSYQWYVDGSARSGATSSTFSFAPASNGSYLITVTVTDSLGAVSAQSNTAIVTVGSALVNPTPTIAPTPTPAVGVNANLTWELPSNIVLPVFAATILVGVYLILKLAKNKTSKVSSLRLFIQINSLIAIFLGLIMGPFQTPLWQPMGPSPRSLLLGAKFLGNRFPDGFSVPVLACYYSNGRTVTCALWQLQAYIFPYWNYSNGYNAIYSTSGLEKIGIVVGLLVIASIILGRFFCGWLCPFGLYQDVLARIRKAHDCGICIFQKKQMRPLHNHGISLLRLF
jgi:YVTN family beta-propeller protein